MKKIVDGLIDQINEVLKIKKYSEIERKMHIKLILKNFKKKTTDLIFLNSNK